MRKFLSALLALVLGLSLTATAFGAEAAAFTDVPADHWAHAYVEQAAKAGVVNGVGDGRFAPDQALTLAEFTAMLLRGVFNIEPAAAGDGAWYSAYTAAADDMGLYENTVVAANFAATGKESAEDYAAFLRNEIDWTAARYDMAAMMYNLAATGETDLPYTGEDLQAARDWAVDSAGTAVADWDMIPEQYRESVAFCFQNGLLTGMDEQGTFVGAGNVTRAQAAVVICRLLDTMEESQPAQEEPAEPEAAPDGPETAPETETSTEPVEEPADDETEPEGPLMPNGQPMTEENVRAAIEALKTEFPEGMTWTNANLYQSHALRINGYGCAGFALKCSDTAFGDLPISRKHSNFDDIRAGDMLRVHNNAHSVIVLEKKEDSVIVAEGNYNDSIHWGREITRETLTSDSQFYVETRYPQGA